MPQVFNHYEWKAAAPPDVGAPDRAAAAVAAQQHGVITLRQLEQCGLGPGALQRRVAAQRLQRLWRGVYAFGHRELRPEGRLLAAVLACGPGAVLSHRSAAERWGILPTARTGIDVTVVTRGGRRRRRGIDVRCVGGLHDSDVTALARIPITSAARTLVDLSAVVTNRKLEKAFEQAHVLQLIAPGAIEEALERAVGRKTAALRRLLAAERSGPTLTRSELEEAFLAICRRGGLPDPEVNVHLHGYEVDFLWRQQKRVVELDGYAFHSGRRAFGRDRRRTSISSSPASRSPASPTSR